MINLTSNYLDLKYDNNIFLINILKMFEAGEYYGKMMNDKTHNGFVEKNETTITGELAEEEFEKMYSAPTEIIVLLSLFYGVISIIAIFGNTLVIWVVATTRQMRTVTNLYIANLAFADVIIGMFCIPFQFQAALLQKWTLPYFMCAFSPFVQTLSVNVSVFTLTAIAVDRHRAILNPLKARPKRFISKMIIIGIWVASFVFAIPCAIAFRVIALNEKFREDGIVYNITKPFCENINLSVEELQSYRYYLVFVQYAIPFCVISYVYIQMAVKLWGSRTPGNAQDARDITLLRNKKKVIKMLIIVVVVFGICWLPLQTYNILYVTWPGINEYTYINIIWFCCDWLAMSNSCYNPFIYGIYNEKFKREFNKRFSRCFCKFTTTNYESHDMTKTTSLHTRASSIRSNYVNTSVRTRNNCLLAQPSSKQQNLISQKSNGSLIRQNNRQSIEMIKNCNITQHNENDLKHTLIVLNNGKISANNVVSSSADSSVDLINNNDGVTSFTLSNKESLLNSDKIFNEIENETKISNESRDASSESDSFLFDCNDEVKNCNSNLIQTNNDKELLKEQNHNNHKNDERSIKENITSIFKIKRNKKNSLTFINDVESRAKTIHFCGSSEIGDGLRKHKGRITDTNRLTLENLTNNYDTNEISLIGSPLINSSNNDTIQLRSSYKNENII